VAGRGDAGVPGPDRPAPPVRASVGDLGTVGRCVRGSIVDLPAQHRRSPTGSDMFVVVASAQQVRPRVPQQWGHEALTRENMGSWAHTWALRSSIHPLQSRPSNLMCYKLRNSGLRLPPSSCQTTRIGHHGTLAGPCLPARLISCVWPLEVFKRCSSRYVASAADELARKARWHLSRSDQL
jgi:hypothetical protein